MNTLYGIVTFRLRKEPNAKKNEQSKPALKFPIQATKWFQVRFWSGYNLVTLNFWNEFGLISCEHTRLSRNQTLKRVTLCTRFRRISLTPVSKNNLLVDRYTGQLFPEL